MEIKLEQFPSLELSPLEIICYLTGVFKLENIHKYSDSHLELVKKTIEFSNYNESKVIEYEKKLLKNPQTKIPTKYKLAMFHRKELIKNKRLVYNNEKSAMPDFKFYEVGQFTQICKKIEFLIERQDELGQLVSSMDSRVNVKKFIEIVIKYCDLDRLDLSEDGKGIIDICTSHSQLANIEKFEELPPIVRLLVECSLDPTLQRSAAQYQGLKQRDYHEQVKRIIEPKVKKMGIRLKDNKGEEIGLGDKNWEKFIQFMQKK